MTEQAERPLNRKGESRGVDKCGPKWPAHGPETRIGRGLESSDSVLLQRFSRLERVTGIEPALSAWELLKLMGMCLVPCVFRGHERPEVSLGRLP
jgi:hypothetical protein